MSKSLLMTIREERNEAFREMAQDLYDYLSPEIDRLMKINCDKEMSKMPVGETLAGLRFSIAMIVASRFMPTHYDGCSMASGLVTIADEMVAQKQMQRRQEHLDKHTVNMIRHAAEHAEEGAKDIDEDPLLATIIELALRGKK